MEERKLICDLRKIAMEEEVPQEEGLQTKIVSQREVSKEWETRCLRKKKSEHFYKKRKP